MYGVLPYMNNHLAEQNKERVRQGIEAIWNAHDWSASERFYAPDIVVYAPTEADPLRGRDAFHQLFTMLQTAFPDIHLAVEDVTAEDDRVAVRWTLTGTNEGSFLGFPATGRKVSLRELALYRLEDGRVKEMWPMPDLLGQMQQLGLVPSGPPPRLLMLLMRLKNRKRRIRRPESSAVPSSARA